MPDKPCGLPHHTYPDSQCAEPTGHTGPHATALVIDGREIDGAVAWDQPARHTVDTITSDALDQLYARIAELERNAAIDDEVIVKSDRECDDHIDAGRRFKAWGEQQKARADRAESAIARVRVLRTDWLSTGAPPIGTSIARWWDKRLTELATALDEPKEPTSAARSIVRCIEVRDPCPHCDDHQLVPRRQMPEHLARLHPAARDR